MLPSKILPLQSEVPPTHQIARWAPMRYIFSKPLEKKYDRFYMLGSLYEGLGGCLGLWCPFCSHCPSLPECWQWRPPHYIAQCMIACCFIWSISLGEDIITTVDLLWWYQWPWLIRAIMVYLISLGHLIFWYDGSTHSHGFLTLHRILAWFVI